jgi:hypothetical protein
MLPSHRRAHLRIWTCLAFAVPLILIAAAFFRPVALMKSPVKLSAATEAAKK